MLKEIEDTWTSLESGNTLEEVGSLNSKHQEIAAEVKTVPVLPVLDMID